MTKTRSILSLCPIVECRIVKKPLVTTFQRKRIAVLELTNLTS